MDENLINQIIEEDDVTEDIDVKEMDVQAEDVEYNIPVEETIYDVEVETEEETVIDIGESMGWVSGDARYHDSLLGVDSPNQHPITAIRNLREELDAIERLKTVYSDKFNVANYYEWQDAAYDEHGYFVSLIPGTTKIRLCNGSDIFGVTVDVAGFVGGQDADVPRDDSYGLIVTSGLVDVRCELNVEVGDYVVCNTSGYAEKSNSDYGYKVLAKETKRGVEYAVISLGVQADVTDAIGQDLLVIDSRLDAAEKNIVSAINVANQAYSKSLEASESSSVSEEDVKKALEAVLGVEKDVEDMYKNFESVSSNSAQAKAIAESAVTSAASMRSEAVEKANDAWTDTNDLIDTLKPITSWTDDISGASGVDYLHTKMNDGIATTYDVKVVDEKTEKSMNAITRNAKELQSLMTVIDKYSVGEYSQANGLTLEQAASILEPGMIYVPTSHKVTKHHEEKYPYTDEAGNPQVFTRKFVPGYLYQWGKLDSGLYGWITIDKYYKETVETSADETSVINTSSMAVYFSHVEILIGGNNNYGYWFANGEEIKDADGNTDVYDPYTLYKWEKPEGEAGYWFAVATLAGNSQNRATSMIRQTANEITHELTNAYGAVAGSGEYMKEDHARVNSIAAWPSDVGTNKYNMAILEKKSDASGAYMTLATVREIEGEDGKSITQLDNIGGAKIVLADAKDGGSFINMDADHINFDVGTYTIDANKIDFTADDFTIDANHIDFTADDFTINAKNINFSTTSFVGRNLLLGTDFGGENKKYTLSSTAGEGGVHFSLSNPIDAGNIVSLSFSIRGEANVRIYWIMDGGNVAIDAIKKDDIDIDKFSLIRKTYSIPNGKILTKVYICTMWGVSTPGEWFEIKDKSLKLEMGTAFTDWSLAPEELVDKAHIISSINMSDEGIQISADKINIKGAITFEALDSGLQDKMDNSVRSTEYLFALSGSQTVAPTSGWSATAPPWEDGKYMWQKTVVTYNRALDATNPVETVTCIQGAKGENGDAYTIILTNESHTFAGSTSYATNGQAASTQIIAYKGTSSVVAKIISVNGVAANTNDTATGIGYLTFRCSATSSVTSPTVTFTTGTLFQTKSCSIPIVVEVDGQQFTKTFSCSIAFKGSIGDSATSYWLVASDSVVHKTESGTLSPTTITFSGKSKTGTENVSAYACRWKIQYTKNGTDYADLYTSTTNESSKQITVDTLYKAVRCQMYLAGGTDTLLDEQTIPIVSDGQNGDKTSKLTNTTTEYCVASEDTDVKNITEWTEDIRSLSVNDDLYIWCRTKFTYADGATSYSDPWLDDAQSAIAKWCYNNNRTYINGGIIGAHTITSNSIHTDAIQSQGYNSGNGESLIPKTGDIYAQNGTFLNLADGAIYSKNLCINPDGSAHFRGTINATGGDIGGWKITTNDIMSDGVGLSSSSLQYTSVVNPDTLSNIRIFAGSSIKTGSHKHTKSLPSSNEDIIHLTYNVEAQGIITNARFGRVFPPCVYSPTITINGNIATVNAYFEKIYGGGVTEINVEYSYMDAKNSQFKVLEDGSLYAKNASIEGMIKTRSVDSIYNPKITSEVEIRDGMTISSWYYEGDAFDSSESYGIQTLSSGRSFVRNRKYQYQDTTTPVFQIDTNPAGITVIGAVKDGEVVAGFRFNCDGTVDLIGKKGDGWSAGGMIS